MVVVVDDSAGRDVEESRDGRALVVVRIFLLVCFHEGMDLEDGVHIILVECEVPAAYDTCRAKRIDDAFGNDFVQAQEVDCNRDAVCPWAVAGPDEAVTARLYRELALAAAKGGSELRLFIVVVFLSCYVEVRSVLSFAILLVDAVEARVGGLELGKVDRAGVHCAFHFYVRTCFADARVNDKVFDFFEIGHGMFLLRNKKLFAAGRKMGLKKPPPRAFI